MKSGSIYVDTRWRGHFGIARFATEVIARLRLDLREIRIGGAPAAAVDPLRLSVALSSLGSRDLWFSPGFNAPLRAPCRVLLTIHDLIHVEVPEETTLAKRAYYAGVVRPTLRRNRRFLTVSRFSADAVAKWAGVSRECGRVVGNGISGAFHAGGPSEPAPRPYFLYVGNRKPHKNLVSLLRAYAEVLTDFPECMLALTGSPSAQLAEQARRANVPIESLRFLGSLDDESLARAYRGARAVVMPSLYEGFGLPALEALACGTPVVASKRCSMPEVLGDSALLVDPEDVCALASSMRGVVQNEGLRQQLIARGLQRAEQFRWDAVARRVERELEEFLAA